MNLHLNNAAVATWLKQYPSELTSFIGLLREKGARHFQRPLAAAAVPVAIMYFLIFRGTAEKLARTNGEIASLTGVVQYAPKYRDLEDRLDAFYGGLPRDKDRARWLNDTVGEALRAENISPMSRTAATEENRGGFAVVSLGLHCRMTYKQFAVWASRLERLRYPVYVTKLSMRKDANEVGINDIDVTLTAVFSKEAK